jgi:flavodoxin
MMTTNTSLRALVIYESMFGNTEWVANAVAAGLRLEGVDATVANVADAPHGTDHDLLVIGGPTHAFSMSRASTRENAVDQGAPPDVAGMGIREWIAGQGASASTGPQFVAVFDTRARKATHLPSAARKAAHLMTRKGFELASSPHGFLVEDVDGPLSDGQLELATAWGRDLAIQTQNRLATASIR